MLTITRLESRDAAVGLHLVPVGGFESDPLWPVVRSAAEELAARLTPLEPLAEYGGGREHTFLGSFEGSPLPADTVRVYVGRLPADSPYLGLGAAGGRYGGAVAVNWLPNYDPATTTRHELLHAVGVDHVGEPRALMATAQPAAVSKDATAFDLPAVRAAGWDLTGVKEVIVASPFGSVGGFARIPAAWWPAWAASGVTADRVTLVNW